jgi:hypothetical protein
MDKKDKAKPKKRSSSGKMIKLIKINLFFKLKI